jgi:hypothetical protein
MHEASYERGEHHHHFPGHAHGPEIYYGYCSDTRRMRMMDYPDYVHNMRRAYSDIYAAMYRNAQGSVRSWYDSVQAFLPGERESRHGGYGCGPSHEHGDCGCGQSHAHGHYGRHGRHHHDHGRCGCHERHERDCHCSCCISDADAVEFAHCGERRLIPLLFENDTRRERDVKLDLGAFATASGHELGWQASFSETEFKLPPCGRKTVMLSVLVDCGRLAGQLGTVAGTERSNEGTDADAVNQRHPSVDECKVGYATVRAEGCIVRPLVVAVAVLPNDCGAHWAGCGCGCCN